MSPTRLVGGEGLTIALVLIGLIAVEGISRLTKTGLSLDVEHLDHADEIVESLSVSEGLRVLVAGNSLVRAGIDPVQLEGELEYQLGRAVTVAALHPDASGPLEWLYLHRRVMLLPGMLPDVVVLGFGPGHLDDRPASAALLRLAAHHVHTRDVSPFLRGELSGVEERSRFLVARFSTAFAMHDRVAARIFDALIPNYRELAPILLRAGTSSPGSTSSTPTFDYLRRLLSEYEAAGIRVVAVPMPAPAPYSVEPSALEMFAEASSPVLRTYRESPLPRERFYDGEHLDEVGKDAFTSALGPALAAELRDEPGRTRY